MSLVESYLKESNPLLVEIEKLKTRLATLEQKFDNEISKVDPYDRAWFISFSVILFSQLFDIQYYDFRISMIFWILLSGLSCTYKYKKLT